MKKMTRQNLDDAINTIMPGSLMWKIDRITLIRMCIVEIFCYPEKYRGMIDEIELLKTAMIQLKTDGQFMFES